MSYAPDPACPYCHGTGELDSGGTHPWGQPLMIPCECSKPRADQLYEALNGLLTANADGQDREAYWAALGQALDVRNAYRNMLQAMLEAKK